MADDNNATEAALREAFQRIDKLSEIFGLPFRPKWAQPIHDVWQGHMRLSRRCADMERTIASQKAEIERLKGNG